MTEYYEQSGHNIQVAAQLVTCAGCGDETRDSVECDTCHSYFCENCYRSFHNGQCEDCYEQEQADLEKRLNEALICFDPPGYWFTGYRFTDDVVILEYISSEKPPIEIHVKKSA